MRDGYQRQTVGIPPERAARRRLLVKSQRSRGCAGLLPSLADASTPPLRTLPRSTLPQATTSPSEWSTVPRRQRLSPLRHRPHASRRPPTVSRPLERRAQGRALPQSDEGRGLPHEPSRRGARPAACLAARGPGPLRPARDRLHQPRGAATLSASPMATSGKARKITLRDLVRKEWVNIALRYLSTTARLTGC